MSVPQAILFLVFNRPEPTSRVFDAIREARPERLYVAADGARTYRAGETELCARVREIATRVDWPCELKTLFRDENLGCKAAVSGGINWFFENEEEGIILEDDCLPGQDFFPFCTQMLERYRDDERVCMVTGDNFQGGISRGEASYYFSRYTHIWGWATWRRAWQHYDLDMSYWPGFRKSKRWRSLFESSREKWYWTRVFDRSYHGRIDTWDYAWLACNWYAGGLTVTPNCNLVENIGMGEDATHTRQSDSTPSYPVQSLGTIAHCDKVERCVEADDHVFKTFFHESWLSLARRSPGILRAEVSRLFS